MRPDHPTETDTRLMIVGMWAARRFLDTTACIGWIHPQKLQDPGWRTEQRAQILGYLRAGAEWAGYRGHSECRFEGCEAGGLGSTDRTDGVWIWPEGLAHYVEHHDVRLPDAFIDTMAARGFEVPAAAEQERKQTTDGEPWLRWCAAQHTLPPRPDAATIEEAQALAATLTIEGCQITVEPAEGRWMVCVQFHGPRAVDLLPPCSLELLALHIHRWRRVPPEANLSLERAQAILTETIPPPSVWSRLRDFLAPGTDNITTIRLDDNGFWSLRSGTVATAMMPLDEVGWRFMIALLGAGETSAYSTINKRLYAAFCTP
jgi:hypothetical protein